jgi:hypothetical protein
MFHDDPPPVAPHGDGPVVVPQGVNALVGLDGLDIDIPAPAATLNRRRAAERAREARLRKGLERKLSKSDDQLTVNKNIIATIASTHPEIARTVFVDHTAQIVTGRLSSELSAALIYAGFSKASSRNPKYVRITSTLTSCFQNRQKAGLDWLIDFLGTMSQQGVKIIVGTMTEWDETKQSMESLVLKGANIDALSAGRRPEFVNKLKSIVHARFKHRRPQSILVQSSTICITMLRGGQVFNMSLQWLTPPIAVPTTSGEAIVKGLRLG